MPIWCIFSHQITLFYWKKTCSLIYYYHLYYKSTYGPCCIFKLCFTNILYNFYHIIVIKIWEEINFTMQKKKKNVLTFHILSSKNNVGVKWTCSQQFPCMGFMTFTSYFKHYIMLQLLFLSMKMIFHYKNYSL